MLQTVIGLSMICPRFNGPYLLATSSYYSTERTEPVLLEKAGQTPTSVCYPSATCVVSYVTLLISKNVVSEHLTLLPSSRVLTFVPQEPGISFEGTVLHMDYGTHNTQACTKDSAQEYTPRQCHRVSVSKFPFRILV